MAKRRRLKVSICWTAFVAALAVIVFVLGLVFAGPTSSLYPVGSLQTLSSKYPGGKVFVRNPELAEEHEILRASGVFEIVSAGETSKIVVLHPREVWAVCGNPLLVTWVTHGLVPTAVSASSTFSFTLEEAGVASEHQFVLEAESRVSTMQRLFKPFRSDTRTLGTILASEYERSQRG